MSTKNTNITLPRYPLKTIDIPLTYAHTITKNLTCILCNKTLNISNTNHQCKIRSSTDKFLIKFKLN